MAVLAYLRHALPEEAVRTLIHIPNGEARDKRTGARLKAMGVKPGAADFHFDWNGGSYYIEVKAERGRMSPSQIDFKRNVIAAGAHYAVVRSINDTMKVLRGWEIPIRAR